jgi:hypothetical protein
LSGASRGWRRSLPRAPRRPANCQRQFFDEVDDDESPQGMLMRLFDRHARRQEPFEEIVRRAIRRRDQLGAPARRKRASG